MFMANVEIKREFAPTALVSNSIALLATTGDTWKKTIDWIIAAAKSLLQQAVFKMTDMDCEGYVAMDKAVAGLRVKWESLSEADKRIIVQHELGLLIVATMTDRQEGLTVWHSFDPESINLMLDEMTKTTLCHDHISTNSLTDYYSQCRQLIISSVPTHIRAEHDHAPTVRANGRLHPRDIYDYRITASNLQDAIASGKITKNIHYCMTLYAPKDSEQPLESILRHRIIPGGKPTLDQFHEYAVRPNSNHRELSTVLVMDDSGYRQALPIDFPQNTYGTVTIDVELLVSSALVDLFVTNQGKLITTSVIPRGCIVCVRAIPANRLVYLVPKLTTMFEVEHHKTDQNRLSQRGDGTYNDDDHGPHNQEVQTTLERLLEHQQQSSKWKWNSAKPREVGCVAENNAIIITNHDSIRDTYKDINFSLFKGACQQNVLSLPNTPIQIPRSDGGDRSIPKADLPHLRPKKRSPENRNFPGDIPLSGTLRAVGQTQW
jgi:hypothetical protein